MSKQASKDQRQGFHYLGTYYERAEDIPGLGRTPDGEPRIVVSDEVLFGVAPMPRVTKPQEQTGQ